VIVTVLLIMLMYYLFFTWKNKAEITLILEWLLLLLVCGWCYLSSLKLWVTVVVLSMFWCLISIVWSPHKLLHDYFHFQLLNLKSVVILWFVAATIYSSFLFLLLVVSSCLTFDIANINIWLWIICYNFVL